MKAFDALIVGAGPAGSAAAIGLARRGYEVALVDRKTFPREKLCGDFLNPINRPMLRDLGVEAELLKQPHGTIASFRIASASGSEAEVEFNACAREIEPGLALSRSVFDQALMNRAASLGVSVYPGCQIDRFRRIDGGWVASGTQGSWQAKTLIGADGRNSRIARQLGLSPKHNSSGGAVGFQFRLQVPGYLSNRIDIYLLPGGYAGLVGLGNGTTNVAMAIEKRRLSGKQDAELLCDHVLSDNPHLRSLLQRRRSAAELRSVYPVHFPARPSVAPGALLVGDAARVTEPVTGEGVYFALRSGLVAADTIDQAMRRGDLGMSGLAGYERACRRIFRRRSAFNSILRYAVYRPALLEPLIRYSARNRLLLNSMISAVCVP